MMDELRDVYRRAAEVIRERGWRQGARDWRKGDAGPVCLGDAVLIASRGLQPIPDAVLFGPLTGGESPSLWNDRAGRTEDEVLDLLERSASGRDRE